MSFDCSGLKAYSGYINDTAELLSCSSGGGSFMLSKAIISAGGVQYLAYATLLTSEKLSMLALNV